MTKYKNGEYTGERALFMSRDCEIDNCVFYDGESPLKESSNLKITNTTFKWKYPLWYCKDVIVDSSVWEETARSGVWYTENLTITNTKILAPKQFRRAKNVKLDNVLIPNALETFWMCENIELNNVKAAGDYLGLNCVDVKVCNLHLDGNYCFDGGKNIVVKNSYLNSKDSFWNCENVTVYDTYINGEYIGWNSKNVTFIRCKIESTQGFCYMDNVKLVDCELINTTLAFEFSTVDAKVKGTIDCVKNPISGVIKADKIEELIMDDSVIDSKMTIIDAEVVNRV